MEKMLQSKVFSESYLRDVYLKIAPLSTRHIKRKFNILVSYLKGERVFQWVGWSEEGGGVWM